VPMAVMLFAALWLSVPAPARAYDTVVSTRAPHVLVAEDLGPSTIDVSSYPEEYQKTYREIFVPVFGFLGGTARAVNSPIIEMAPELQAVERRQHPELWDVGVADISTDGWKRRATEILHRPACCGACPVLTIEKARALWRFLVYDSLQRKTGANASAWAAQRRELLRRFKERAANEAEVSTLAVRERQQ